MKKQNSPKTKPPLKTENSPRVKSSLVEVDKTLDTTTMLNLYASSTPSMREFYTRSAVEKILKSFAEKIKDYLDKIRKDNTIWRSSPDEVNSLIEDKVDKLLEEELRK